MDAKKLGTVKWYDRTLGYGFIQTTDSEKDIFVHRSQVLGGKFLSKEQTVQFDITESPKGKCAVDVEILTNPV